MAGQSDKVKNKVKEKSAKHTEDEKLEREGERDHAKSKVKDAPYARLA